MKKKPETMAEAFGEVNKYYLMFIDEIVVKLKLVVDKILYWLE